LVRIFKAIYLYILYFYRLVFPFWRAFPFIRLRWKISESARKKHTYIVAGSGAGKSELIKLLILSYVRKKPRKETIILLDPRGDIAQQVAKFKEHRTPQDLVYISPDLQKGFTPCINPLEMGQGADPRQINYMAECLTEVFKEIVGEQTHITANMETLLKAVLSVLLIREGSTLLDLQKFMRDDENEELIAFAVQSSNQGQRHFFTNAFLDKNYTATKNALYTKIQSLLNSETFYRLTIGKSTVNLRELMNSKKTIIFNLSKGLIGQQTSPAFGRFIVGMIQGFSFERQQIPESQRIPVYLFIDEFQNFIPPSIETLLAESRKYAVHLTLAQQFHGQGTSPALRGAILNNTAVKIAGTGEGASLDAISKVMTGTTKEELQNLLTGEFFVKTRANNILESALNENLAQKMKVTTKFIGDRHTMKPQQWQSVKEYQLKHYYKSINGKISAVYDKESENHLKTFNTSENANYQALKKEPVKPMY